MPYITLDERSRLAHGGRPPQSAGELNYCFTKVALAYLAEVGLSYQTINDVLGALSGASKEFYRRVAKPYEDRKRELNGDVYP